MGRLRAAWKALTGRSETHNALLSALSPFSQVPRRGTRELLQAYHRLPFFHSLARRVAEDVAAIPFEVYAPKGRRGRAVSRSIASAGGEVRSLLVARAVQAGDLEPLESHEVLDVLAHCNPFHGGHDTWVLTQLCLDILGQAPLLRENDMRGRVLELWPLAPHWVQEMPRPEHPYYRVSWGTYNRDVPEEAILWGRVPDPENPYGRGVSYGSAMSDGLDLGEYREKYAAALFRNDATPSGIVAVEGAQEYELAKQKAEHDAQHRGPSRAGRLKWTGGRTSFTAISPPLADLQVREMRSDDRAFVQEVLNIPPEILGVLENSNRSTIDAAYYLYARGCLVPRKSRQAGFLQPLLDEYGAGLVLGFANPVPEDTEAHHKHMVQVPTAFRVNEHRRAGGEAPLDGPEGEALFSPSGSTPEPQPTPVDRSGDPPWVRSLHRVTRATSATVAAALEALRPERLTVELAPLEESELQRWAEEALRALGVTAAFDMRNPLVRETVQEAGTRIRGITSTTLDVLRAEFDEGLFAGEGAEALARRVEAVFDAADRTRALLIARTEATATANAAQQHAWEQSGVVEGKEWVSVQDGASGDRHHERMNGQRVPLDGLFVAPSGKKAKHPGGFSSADETANCRCAMVPYVADPEETRSVQRAMSPDALEAYRARHDSLESALAAAVRRGFAAQRADVLAALRRTA